VTSRVSPKGECVICENAINEKKALKKGKATRVIFEIDGETHDEVIHNNCLAIVQHWIPERIKEIKT
jgi:hypothetical protein